MERLVVGRPKTDVSFNKAPRRPSAAAQRPVQKSEDPCPPPQKPKAHPPRKDFDLSALSPSSPLFSLFGREIFGEDLLLLLLIFLLIEENADKLLIGVLIYVFLG